MCGFFLVATVQFSFDNVVTLQALCIVMSEYISCDSQTRNKSALSKITFYLIFLQNL